MISGSRPSDFCTDYLDKSSDSSIVFTDDNICGEGASCIVYRMRIGGLRLAVKRLRAEYHSRPEYLASYRKEFLIGQQLKHDGIPVYRDFKADNDEVYILMDFIDGISLNDFINTEAGKEYFSDADNVDRFLSQLLNVTGYLHRSGVIHCDIKPSNIMLRRSDMGVMLIDLDKSYCDSIDSTHGGTIGNSDPLTGNEHPTVGKDLSAIGNLISYLAEKVKQFPARRFRRFRKECYNTRATYGSLHKALRPHSSSGIFIIIAFVVSIMLAGGYLAYRSSQTSDDQMNNGAAAATDAMTPRASGTEEYISDTTVSANNVTTDISAQKPGIAYDFDKRMSAFIHEAEEAFSDLATGTMTDNDIHDMIYRIMDSYHDRYHEVMNEYKIENPAMTEIDVELTVAERTKRSHATKLREGFVQAAADTIKMRHPESYDDLN